MKNILIIGSGRSSSYLIKYLLENSGKEDWKIKVGDISIESAKQKIGNNPNATAVLFDSNNQPLRESSIQQADLVISMLPAHMHISIAKDCFKFKKNFITASYVSKEMQEMHEEVKNANILFLNEIGVDPGIDHMSAMKVIDDLRNKRIELEGFETFTGGLIAPKSDDNPWHYKFTWNPRNVVLAGQGGVKFLHHGEYKYIPYHKIFSRIEILHIDEYGEFEAYANRDSLKYREVYGLQNIKTMYRGTLRKAGFCKAWDILLQLGMTDDSFTMENTENMTYRDFTNSFLIYRKSDSEELKLAYHCGIRLDSPTMERLRWLGIFDNTKVGISNATPAQILQRILEQKLALKPEDKDMIVMLHKFDFTLQGKRKQIQSSLCVEGEDPVYTAMAKTVGLPMAIAAKMILQNKFSIKGVAIPIHKEIYLPVLKELESFGIHLKEKEIERFEE
jgi:saccharopine dehydrogenase-like NADP-dependent oxidoreductase